MTEREYFEAGYHNMTSHEPPGGVEQMAYWAGQWCRRHGITPREYKRTGKSTFRVNRTLRLHFTTDLLLPKVTRI